MKRISFLLFVCLITFLLSVSCNDKSEGPEDDEVDYAPVIKPADFVSKIDNKYFPLLDSMVYTYHGTNEGGQTVRTHVTNQRKLILGVRCIEVADTVYNSVTHKVVEATFDWYAQDKEGNVWYFGEYTKEFDSAGVIISTEGSWEADVNDAQPGIIMKAHPAVGDHYRQEYYKDEAEDEAEVISVTDSATVLFGGRYTNCVTTKEWSRLEPNVIEKKYYAANVGCILITFISGGTGRVELTNYAKE